MGNASLSLSTLIRDNPHLAKELANLLTKSESHTRRNVSKYTSYQEIRRTGSAIISMLTLVCEENLAVFAEQGLTIGNAWRLAAVADAARVLYPVGREALGIPPLKPENSSLGAKGQRTDWRRSLVEVSAQATAADAPGPVEEATGANGPE